jgi:alanyl-tRNA synthetase
MVVILGAANESANIISMAGEEAIEKGVDCGKVVTDASKILGGGGGGKPSMGQGGGGKVEKLEEAIKIAFDSCKGQLGGS